ncbi:MAG TPA: hypothetical protein PKE62_07655 [Anaerolineales bacterium]|nr:hypothetical protein [Anaerolineales bacterium]
MITNITAKSRTSARISPAVKAVRDYLLPFMVCFAVALVSGLFYYLVPRSWNWFASQAALWIHLITGILGFFYLIPYVLSHYKKKGESAINLIFVWRAFRRNENESDWSYQQRVYGHILNWIMALLGLSGFVLLIPSLLWMGGVVWMAGYPAYQIANLGHLGFALLALTFIGFHVARRRKRASSQ